MRERRVRRALLAMVLGVSSMSAAAAWAASPDEIVAEVRRATARYTDIARARDDGFVQISGMEPEHGYHFLNVRAQIMSAASQLTSGDLDLSRPPMLLYVVVRAAAGSTGEASGREERDGEWRLVGVEYALPSPPAVSPFPGADWHRHEASCHYRDYREHPAARASACPARHPQTGSAFILWHPAFAVAHVWAWYPNPDGPFAASNRSLASYGGTPMVDGHHHARSEAEVAYSNFNHRVAGAFVLLLAIATAWEARRRGRRAIVSAPLWVVLGLYVFVSADPESWPLGPKQFLEIFSDPLVIQHKTLALIPIAIGVLTALGGIAGSGRWVYALPALVVGGAVALFYHDHEGGLHLNRVFVQHATMGLAGVAAGVALVVARRTGDRPMWRRAWPALLFVIALVLLIFSE